MKKSLQRCFRVAFRKTSPPKLVLLGRSQRGHQGDGGSLTSSLARRTGEFTWDGDVRAEWHRRPSRTCPVPRATSPGDRMLSSNTPQHELRPSVPTGHIDTTTAPAVLAANNCVHQSKDIQKGPRLTWCLQRAYHGDGSCYKSKSRAAELCPRAVRNLDGRMVTYEECAT